MKKIVTLIFCVMLILAMAGCGQSPKAADKATSTQQAIIDKANKAPEKQEFTAVTEVQEGRKNVYVVLKVLKGDYWSQVVRGLKDGGLAANCNVYVGGPYKETNWQAQTEMLKSLVGKKADAVVLATSDSVQLIPTVEELRKAKLPVVLVDTGLNTKQYNAAYMTNNFDAGSKAAEEMLKLLHSNGLKEAEKATVVMKVSSLKSQNMVERIEGANAYWQAKAPSAWRLEPKAMVDYGDKALSMELSQKALKEIGDLKGFISCNNSTTLNAAEAILASKRKDVVLVGFDYAKETAALIANPDFKAVSIVQNQYAMGVESVKKAVELASGAQAEQVNVDTGIGVVTIENYKAYEAKLADRAK
ncbi:MAG: substrate-binding domain-containing protein [Phascolarctobacterium sp.]|nr:substrate-binding domain-containing protein [Phascolarctobacterium sp.]